MENSRKPLNYREALLKATELCSQSEKCPFDMEMKCREWQLSSDESRQLLAYLLQEKFIVPLRYAESFVRDRFKLNKWGRIKIAYQLRQKQLGSQVVQEALDVLEEDTYHQVLLDLLVAKARTLKMTDHYVRKNKLLAFAQSRGFELDIALQLVNKI